MGTPIHAVHVYAMLVLIFLTSALSGSLKAITECTTIKKKLHSKRWKKMFFSMPFDKAIQSNPRELHSHLLRFCFSPPAAKKDSADGRSRLIEWRAQILVSINAMPSSSPPPPTL